MSILSNTECHNSQRDSCFQELADDIIYSILEFSESLFILRVCMRISKQWLRKALEIPLSYKFYGTTMVDHCYQSYEKSISNTINRSNIIMMSTESTNTVGKILENMTELSFVGVDMNTLSENNVIHMITQLKFRKKLKKLEISQCSLLSHNVKRLLSCENLQNLENLVLTKTELKSEAVEYICKSTLLKRLQSLNLSSNDITDVDMKMISESETLCNVTQLNLSHTKIQHSGIIALMNSPFITQLSTLHLGYLKFQSNELQTIVSNPRCNHLRSIHLQCNSIRTEGARILARSEFVYNITQLDLGHNKIQNDGVNYIVTSTNLKNLKESKIIPWK
ncbi:hypothetical protein C9374_003587 [Naegleria lovaniensis]|uniref:Uncharacterized protein n=1 Tax=Naegleria lovaniensis TaxID=51637 RepID=A0AA88H3F9_NAELO|nr:uncharacterized protein C9374_003587 [Naegleria lovaniensis]KAG2393823.1 hypothetical protein C9374_003587 [Naegleria lovaniensis]